MKGNTYFYVGVALFTVGAAAFGYTSKDELRKGARNLPVVGGMV